MALKSNFEDSNVISSPFVDEVANPGDVVNAASPLQLARQGASTGTIALRKRQITAAKGDQRSTVQKVKDKGGKFNAALKAAQGVNTFAKTGDALDKLRKK